MDLQDNFVSAIQTNNGQVYAFTSGRSNTTKIKLKVGSTFETIFESQQIGGAPKQGATDVFHNLIHYGATGATGKINIIDGKAFHYRTFVTGAIGMLRNLSQGYLFAGSSGLIEYLDLSGYKSNADFRTRLYSLPYKSTIDKIIVYPSKIESGGSIQLSLFRDYATLSIGGAADELGGITLSYSTYGNASAINVPLPHRITDLNAFYMNIRLNSASVRKIEIYYSPTNKA